MSKSITHQTYVRPLTMVSGFSFTTFNILAEGYCTPSITQTISRAALKPLKSPGNKDSTGSNAPSETTMPASSASKK